jgi:hypothetical protein
MAKMAPMTERHFLEASWGGEASER